MKIREEGPAVTKKERPALRKGIIESNAIAPITDLYLEVDTICYH